MEKRADSMEKRMDGKFFITTSISLVALFNSLRKPSTFEPVKQANSYILPFKISILNMSTALVDERLRTE